MPSSATAVQAVDSGASDSRPSKGKQQKYSDKDVLEFAVKEMGFHHGNPIHRPDGNPRFVIKDEGPKGKLVYDRGNHKAIDRVARFISRMKKRDKDGL